MLSSGVGGLTMRFLGVAGTDCRAESVKIVRHVAFDAGIESKQVAALGTSSYDLRRWY